MLFVLDPAEVYHRITTVYLFTLLRIVFLLLLHVEQNLNNHNLLSYSYICLLQAHMLCQIKSEKAVELFYNLVHVISFNWKKHTNNTCSHVCCIEFILWSLYFLSTVVYLTYNFNFYLKILQSVINKLQ